MPWELYLYDPTGNILSVTRNTTSPNPIKGDIKVIIDAGGRTNSINFRARNDILQAPPRGVIQYKAWTNLEVTFQGERVTFGGQQVTIRDNYAPLAAGVIVTSPPVTSPGSGPADKDADALDRLTAVGLEQLLRERIVEPVLFPNDTPVWVLAAQLVGLFAHPAISNIIVATSEGLDYWLGVFYAPEMTLADALDKLAETVPGGAHWYVDALKRVVFKAGAAA